MDHSTSIATVEDYAEVQRDEAARDARDTWPNSTICAASPAKDAAGAASTNTSKVTPRLVLGGLLAATR
jgi:hypothetical protein